MLRTLGCKLLGTEILSVGVLGGTHSQRTFRRVEVCLVSADDGRVLKIEALETPSICQQLIPCPTDEVKTILLELSLPVGDLSQQSVSPTIDVLIGSDHFWDFLTGKVKRLTSALTAFETVFGWAVQGKISTACNGTNCSQAIVLRTTVTDQETAPILKAFWELESIGVSDLPETAADERLMKEFSGNIKEVNGRYEIRLPWKNEVELADNRAVAERRFRQLTKRLVKAPSLLQEYDNEVRRLLAEGVAESVRDETHNDGQRIYYMPHQPVLRESSTTTKLRIVFDASSHSVGAKSRN